MVNVNESRLQRRLSPERLDHLAPADPLAIRSRADLRRINRLMGSGGLIARALQAHAVRMPPLRDHRPQRIIELGAGDGSLMLRLAKKFAQRWPGAHLTLLDRQNVVGASTLDEFDRLGWTVDVLCLDVNEWIAASVRERWDMAIANLFIHHFDSSTIAALFTALGERCNWFMACEPRRSRLRLLASRLIFLAGANAVTREDAVLSVRAGFSDTELSALWPRRASQWVRQEGPAGLFSHTFVAYRKGT
ncbi:MAG: hypothetical protein ABI228_06060 [Burkholderiaceae bacterium]